jgi:hypothetical protein
VRCRGVRAYHHEILPFDSHEVVRAHFDKMVCN